VTPDDVDCMACVANLAAGIPSEEGVSMPWRGMTHGVHWSMASGVIRPLCAFSWTKGTWMVDTGPSRGWRIE
jgi:hypothetical protein